MAIKLTQQQINQIVTDAKGMTGSRTCISEKIAKKYKITPPTVRRYMNKDAEYSRKNTVLKPEEITKIRQAYLNHPSDVRHVKIKELCITFSRSECSIRKAIKDNTKQESSNKMFDYKQFYF